MRLHGDLGEWFKPAVLKTADGQPSVSSNLTVSARSRVFMRSKALHQPAHGNRQSPHSSRPTSQSRAPAMGLCCFWLRAVTPTASGNPDTPAAPFDTFWRCSCFLELHFWGSVQMPRLRSIGVGTPTPVSRAKAAKRLTRPLLCLTPKGRKQHSFISAQPSKGRGTGPPKRAAPGGGPWSGQSAFLKT